MILTNKHNLPKAIVQAIVKMQYEPDPSRIGVTTMIGSPYPRMLKLKHYHEMVRDVSDYFWALFGTAVHKVLEESDNTVVNEISVKTNFPELQIDDIYLTGVTDQFDPKINELSDWKVTSKFGGNKMKPEWEAQVNVNAWLLESVLGWQVDTLKIYVIMIDYYAKDKFIHGMPDTPLKTFNVRKWSKEEVYKYIDQRLALHLKSPCEGCTDAERWSGVSYAVKKIGGKKAVTGGVFDNKTDAMKHLYSIGGESHYEMETRKKPDGKCQLYCDVNQYCKYYQENYMKHKKD